MSQVPWPPAKSRVGSCAFLGCLPDACVTWKAIRYQKKDQELRSVARVSMDFLRSFSDFKPRLVLTIKSGWRVAVVVSVNCFMPKFCGRSIFDTWLTWPHGLRMLRWLRYAAFHAAFVWSKLGEFLSWSFFVFEAGTEKRDAVGSEREIPGRLACEDVLPHGTGIWARPDAVHLRGSLFAWHGHLHSSHRTVLPRGFDEISRNFVRRTSWSRWVSDFVAPIRGRSRLMGADDPRQRPHGGATGVPWSFHCKWSMPYSTFSAGFPRFQDLNLIDCSVIILPCFALFCFMFGIFLCQFLCPLSRWKSK